MTDRVATRALPRRVAQVAAQVAAQIAALDAAAKGDDTAIAAAEARLARAIGGLNEALEPGSPMDSALANATAAAGATADLLFRLRRQPAAAASDELRGATAAAIAAQFALVDAAGESVSRTLAARVSVAERQRALLLALLLALILALGTAAAGLAWQVYRALSRRNGLAGAAGHPVPADAAAPTVPTDGQARIEHEAGRLLQRLREPGDTAPENPTSASAAALKAPTQGI